MRTETRIQILRFPDAPAHCRWCLPCIHENAVLQEVGRDVRRVDVAGSLAGGDKEGGQPAASETCSAVATVLSPDIADVVEIAPPEQRRVARAGSIETAAGSPRGGPWTRSDCWFRCIGSVGCGRGGVSFVGGPRRSRVLAASPSSGGA